MKLINIIAAVTICLFAIQSHGAQNGRDRQVTNIHEFGLYVSPGEGHWVQSKTDDGSIVILEDRSVWQIDPLDQIDTALWLPMTEITVVEINGGYLLINTDDGEKAHARLIR